jgi:SAM-dependent methyltransferase
MIESVLDEFSKTEFDFREFANPSDPLSALFEEWIPYYRLKYCIAKALQPQSILEVGVRFGYSARTFLEASPAAQLLGIDLDCSRFGGQAGALDWARRITANHNARFVVGDSQKMKRFPGGIYDLIHVDGQQDGLGSFHDLRRAVSQGRWVLLDGYFWTRQNFFNANDFLLKYKDIIRYAVTIPGYAGELLIRVSDDYLAAVKSVPSSGAGTSREIVGFYDSNYYLRDCGGFDVFRRSGGKQLGDGRLISLLRLARLGHGHAALDLGCGRGEIVYQLARRGYEVTAVDYSTASIALAKGCFKDENAALCERVEFICADATRLELGRKFDVVIAGDIIEHLAPTELSRLHETVGWHLEQNGIFLVHTYPNAWFYRRHWPRLRAAASELGAFLPAEPRSRYELLMHINEQSPALLQRSLKKVFSHVKVWVGCSDAPGENLMRRCSISELISAPEIYALASHSPLDLERAKQLLSQSRLSAGVHSCIRLEVCQCPAAVGATAIFQVHIQLVNDSTQQISSIAPYPIHVSYHWLAKDLDRMIIYDGLRTVVPDVIEAGETCGMDASIQAPANLGDYRLMITLVQEGCCWFNDMPGGAQNVREISVV